MEIQKLVHESFYSCINNKPVKDLLFLNYLANIVY